MAKSLQEILGYIPLTGHIKKTTSGIPNPLPAEFFKVTKRVLGDKGRYTVTTGERRVSRINRYGSASRRREMRPVGERDIRLLHTFENQPIDPTTMRLLRSLTAYEQTGGEQEVQRQVGEFKALFANLRIATTMQVLARGKLYYDANGNLLPTSSGAVETHDFQIDANNQNQLNGLVDFSWALPNTNIPGHLNTLKLRSAQDTGYEVTQCLYGRNIVKYMTQNDFVIDYLSRNPTWSSKFLDSNVVPDGLFGYKWIPMFSTFYEDNNGTNQEIWDADLAVFAPPVDEGWWDFMEGSFPVPRSINIVPGGGASLNRFDDVFGMFAYGLDSHDPPGTTTYCGDTFVPALKNQKAVYQATVAF